MYLTQPEDAQIVWNLRNFFIYDYCQVLPHRCPKKGLYDTKIENVAWAEHSAIYLAYEDADIVGYSFLSSLQQESEPYTYLYEFWVAPFYRGCGKATEFFRLLTQTAEGEWRLFVHMNNGRAKRFWKKCLAPKNATRQRYTEGDHDGWLYIWHE